MLLKICNVDVYKKCRSVNNRTRAIIHKRYHQTISSSDSNIVSEQVKSKDITFEDLFKTSKFVEVFDPVGKIVDGKIIAVDGPNLYIDFGGKFHAVAIRPNRYSEKYIKGARVKVLIKDLEVGMHFLGSSTDTSSLEASVELIGLL